MVATIAQVVRVLSKGKYTIGPEGTISSEDAEILEELLADEVSRKDPGFSAAELVRYKAYLILDVIVNSGGTGNIVEKKVKDTAWKIARSSIPRSTSVWYDYSEKMIAQHSGNVMPSGVARSDAYVHGLDSTDIAQYGDPASSEQP
ncbi:MAG TPA: hypothetical protein VHO70_02610 [Chitinispirillaceae bacterium]|nr:hypothetical protein [Chitinispirillaceae bacterium]